MRILYISHFFPPIRNAGTENYTLGLAVAMQAKGHEVQVVCAEDWDLGSTYWNGVTRDTYGGVLVNRIHLNWVKANNPNRVLYDSRRVEKWLNSFLTDQKPDIVHVTSAATLGIGVIRAVHQLGIPQVLTLMDFWFMCPRTVLLTGDGRLCDGRTTTWECQQCLLTSSGVYKQVSRLLAKDAQKRYWNLTSKTSLLSRVRGARGLALNMEERRAMLEEALDAPDVILSHSKFVQQMFRQADLGQRIRYLPNGHDLGWAESYQGKSTSNVLRIGYIGQVIVVKGVHVLIEAFQRAGLTGKARLDIWGNLQHAPDYVELLQTLIGDDTVIALQGRFEHFQLALVLADIDLLVVPSLWYENAPLVIHEAFAAETPVVASGLGGMAELVHHEVNGLLFARGDADDLARQLKRVADEPGLLEQLRRGIPAVKTVAEESTELESLYRDMITVRREYAKMLSAPPGRKS